MVIRRRQLIASAVAAIAALTGWRFVRGSPEDAVVTVLRKRLGYLQLEESGVQAYAKDLVARTALSSNKLRVIGMAGPIYARFELFVHQDALARELRHGEERVVSLYLLSSDFFENGADESRMVRYAGFYDPVREPRPCGNPFARPLVT